MFYQSGYSKEENISSGDKTRATVRDIESFDQRLSECPSVLSGLSREIRTRMNAIVAFSFLLNKKDYSEREKQEFSYNIYNSCEQILSVFDNYLDSAIIDSGNSKTSRDSCNPDKMFNDIFLEFGKEINDCDGSELIFIPEIPENQSKDLIIDTGRYTRLICNLLQLAKYNTRSGYIKAGYYFRDKSLNCYILDTGEGYFKTKEFFSTTDFSKSLSKYDDVVIAVNITLIRKLLQLMDGSVTIESNRLTGCSIYTTVPAFYSDNNDRLNKFSNTMSAI